MSFDSTSWWNTETQRFEHVDCYDHVPVCNSDDCQGQERRIKYLDLETGEHLDSVYAYKGIACQYLPVQEVIEIEEERTRVWQAKVKAENAEATELAAKFP